MLLTKYTKLFLQIVSLLSQYFKTLQKLKYVFFLFKTSLSTFGSSYYPILWSELSVKTKPYQMWSIIIWILCSGKPCKNGKRPKCTMAGFGKFCPKTLGLGMNFCYCGFIFILFLNILAPKALKTVDHVLSF